MSREVMQMALDMLNEIADDVYCDQKLEGVITALRQALETEQEPVAWANSFDLQNFDMKVRTCPDLHHTVPLYTAPPKQWVGLTDEEIQEVVSKKWWDWEDAFDIEGFSRAIERVLKEKNHD